MQLHTSHNHIAAKGLARVYEIQVTGEINMSQEGVGPHPGDMESFKEL